MTALKDPDQSQVSASISAGIKAAEKIAPLLPRRTGNVPPYQLTSYSYAAGEPFHSGLCREVTLTSGPHVIIVRVREKDRGLFDEVSALWIPTSARATTTFKKPAGRDAESKKPVVIHHWFTFDEDGNPIDADIIVDCARGALGHCKSILEHQEGIWQADFLNPDVPMLTTLAQRRYEVGQRRYEVVFPLRENKATATIHVWEDASPSPRSLLHNDPWVTVSLVVKTELCTIILVRNPDGEWAVT